MTHFALYLTVFTSLIQLNLVFGLQISGNIIFPGSTRVSSQLEDKNAFTDQPFRKSNTDRNVSNVRSTIVRVINNNENNEMRKKTNSPNERGEETVITEKSIRKQSNFDDLSYDFSKTDKLYRVSDLLRFLGVEDDKTDDGIMLRKLNDDPAQVGCHSEWRTVDLAMELKKNGEDFKIFPECIKAKRCAGCCGFNSGRVCTPTKIDKISVNAAVIRVKRSCDDLTCSSEIDKDNLRKVFQIDNHEECNCLCKKNVKDCNENQDWDDKSCKCICKDSESLRSTCWQNSQKKWNDKNCQCECKKLLTCSTGLQFSHKTCSCARKGQN